jgi:two-component system chemotaxis response regulator CheY
VVKVLIVDDSSFARLNLRRAVEKAGHTVLEAASGASAIEMVQKEPVDIITLDLLMPGMPGAEALTLLKQACPQARVIIITADVQTPTRNALLEAGADAFLNKPVPAAVLEDTIHSLMGI